MRFKVVVLALVALFATSALASAQSQTGEIFGKVTDGSGASPARRHGDGHGSGAAPAADGGHERNRAPSSSRVLKSAPTR